MSRGRAERSAGAGFIWRSDPLTAKPASHSVSVITSTEAKKKWILRPVAKLILKGIV